MRENTSNVFKRGMHYLLLAILGVGMFCNHIFAQNDCSYKQLHLVINPTKLIEEILDNVCNSFSNCLCVRESIPFYCTMIVNDTTMTIRLEQGTNIDPPFPYVFVYMGIPFFVHQSSDISNLFHKTQNFLCSDTLFGGVNFNKDVVHGYSYFKENDYFEARFLLNKGQLNMYCEHPCILDSANIPNLKPQNIHYTKRSLKKIQIYSPYVDTMSYATVFLYIKFNNIKEMKVLNINNISYMWVFKSTDGGYPNKEFFYYDGCEISDSIQYLYYKSQIENNINKIHFYVPKKYTMLKKIKQKYGFGDYTIAKYKVSDNEPVILKLKILPFKHE